ncbi:MAG: T9SS type A sorting domain-containing protein [Saprospiraceae bacterium]
MSAPPPNGSNPDSLIIDRFGNAYDKEDLLIPPPTSNASGSACDAGIFAITWDADFPANMMPTVCQVLSDLSASIVSHNNQMDCGDAIPSTPVQIQVLWESHQSDPNLIQSVDVLGSGTPFYSAPQDVDCDEMILDRPFIKINGGIVYPFANEIFDGRLVINSDPQSPDGLTMYPWHIDWTTQPAQDEIDLYSVVLHEIMHVLGFASRMNIPPYSLWDRVLNIASDFPGPGQTVQPVLAPTIITNPPCGVGTSNCWKLNEPLISTLAQLESIVVNNCVPNLPDVVVGNSIAAIDGSNTGGIGSKLSHLSEACNGQTEVFVMTSGLAPGTTRRVVNLKEWQILCELGYEINSTSFSCQGCYSIAHSDQAGQIQEMGCCSQVFHGCANEPIEILNSELLCNDITNGQEQLVTRVWSTSNISMDIEPNANSSGWIITIDPLQSGNSQYDLNYSVSGCNCRMHNSRFTILLEQLCPDCIYQGDMCGNLLCYGDFENYTNILGIESWLGYPFLIEGNTQVGTPDIQALNGNHSLHMGGGPAYQNAVEPVSMELQKCISPGCSLTLDVDLATGSIATLAVWGSTSPPCAATDAPATPIADNCIEITVCSQNYEFIPVCIGNLPVASTIPPSDPFNVTFGPDNHVTHIWKNLTDQDVCYLTFVPTGSNVFLDNITATITCEPEITCDNPAPQNVCQGAISNIFFEVCAPSMPECLDLTLVTPTVVLPPGWTLAGSTPVPFTLTEGQCQTIALQVQVPANSPIGSMEMIILSGTATGLCTTVDWNCSADVTVIDCGTPQSFTCSCPSGGYNIDASDNSPHYNPVLGGTPYSALEAAFNYDQNNDNKITPNEHNNCIAILGNLIIDRNLDILDCDNVQMQPCSKITVGTIAPPYRTMRLEGNTIYSCSTMWHGITINPHSGLNFKGNTIRDAQFANEAIGGFGQVGDPSTRLFATGNVYTNNHVGVFFPGSAAKIVIHIPFEGNTFNSTANLLPPCDASLFNYSSTLRGFAGVVTNGTSLTVGTAGNSGIVNNFSLIRNGVISSNAVINVHRAGFQNIIGINTPSVPNVANVRGNGVVASRGIANVLNCNFETVGTGVFGFNNQRLTVRNNTMNAMRIGVETRGVQSSNISDNPSIGFANTGILCRGVIPTAGLNSHRIENNTNMFISPFPGIVQPHYAVAIDIDNAMSDDAGVASITNNHFLSGGTLSDGIRLNGSGGWDIDDNTIDFQAPASPFFSNSGYGIRLCNTHENYLYQNHINDFDLNLRESIGLSLEIGTGNRYCCNSTFGNQVGSYFLGACGSSEWRVTDMLKHGTSLLCAAGTMISPQFDYGNNFNPTSGTAFHGGSFDEVQQSRFEVLDMLQPHWPEAISTPNVTTVEFFDDDGVDAYCAAPCTAPQYAPPPPDRDIDESDLTTASGGFSAGQYGTALQWESERRLYERMSDYEGMIGANASTDAFYATANDGKIGAYYQTEYVTKGIYNYPSSIANGLQTSVVQLEGNRLAVEAILAGLAQAQNAGDSALIYQNANTEHEYGQAAAETLIDYQIEGQAFSSAQAFNSYLATNMLPADNLLEQNRKSAQRLYLQTLGMGIAQLNPEQLAEAESIAIQCPLVGGSAVYAARALYRLNIDKVFVDDSLCISTQERKEAHEKKPTVEAVSLVPNPASEVVTIKGISLSKEQPVEVILFDMNGKVRIHRVIETGDATLSTIGLLDGVYICEIKVRGKPPIALKLIIVH